MQESDKIRFIAEYKEKLYLDNEIFDSYRMEVAEIHKALRKLVKHGYTVIDLEGQVVTKWNIDDDNKPNVNYKRAPKLPQT